MCPPHRPTLAFSTGYTAVWVLLMIRPKGSASVPAPITVDVSTLVAVAVAVIDTPGTVLLVTVSFGPLVKFSARTGSLSAVAWSGTWPPLATMSRLPRSYEPLSQPFSAEVRLRWRC